MLAKPQGRFPLFRVLSTIALIGLGLAGCTRPMIGKEPEVEKEGAKTTEKAAEKPESTTEKGGAEQAGDEKAGDEKMVAAKHGPAAGEHAAIEELREIAERSYEETLGFFEAGDAFAHEVYRWSRVLLDHDLELATDDDKKILSTEAHLDRMTNLAHAGLWRGASSNITLPKPS